jgi:ankyrin repeat protein
MFSPQWRFRQAAASGNLNQVKALYNHHGGDVVNAGDNAGWTALHYASKNNRLEVVNYLDQTCHADVESRSSKGETPLHVASEFGAGKVLSYLLDIAGADKQAVDNNGQTPMDLARKARQFGVVECLVAELHNELLDAVRHGNLDLVHRLVKEKRDNGEKDLDGQTNVLGQLMLGNAIVNRRTEMVRYIVETGIAKVNGATDRYEASPLHLAVMVDHMPLLVMLVHDFGANIHALDEKGLTPLGMAKRRNRLNVRLSANALNYLESIEKKANTQSRALEAESWHTTHPL